MWKIDLKPVCCDHFLESSRCGLAAEAMLSWILINSSALVSPLGAESGWWHHHSLGDTYVLMDFFTTPNRKLVNLWTSRENVHNFRSPIGCLMCTYLGVGLLTFLPSFPKCTLEMRLVLATCSARNLFRSYMVEYLWLKVPRKMLCVEKSLNC